MGYITWTANIQNSPITNHNSPTDLITYGSWDTTICKMLPISQLCFQRGGIYGGDHLCKGSHAKAVQLPGKRKGLGKAGKEPQPGVRYPIQQGSTENLVAPGAKSRYLEPTLWGVYPIIHRLVVYFKYLCPSNFPIESLCMGLAPYIRLEGVFQSIIVLPPLCCYET